MGYCRSLIRQQGDCNSPATMVQATNKLFKDMVFNDPVTYIDDIIIFSDTYDEHVATLHNVLQGLLDEKFCLEHSKCLFHT